MTVSRAFDPEAPIRDRTRRKILATAEDIGYVHNRSASDLASGRRRGIGMIVPTLQESIYLPMVEGARRAFDAHGASFFLQAIDYERRNEMGALTTLLSSRVRAVLLPSIGHTAKAADFIRKLSVPVIEAGNLPELPIHAAVGHSDFKAGFMATHHLIASGRTRIAMICGQPNQTSNSRDRLRGYRAALREAGLIADPGRIAFTDHSCAGAAKALTRIVASGTPFDSVVAAGELWSPPVLLSLLKSGRRVPDDVAVMGIGDVALGEFFPVGLSVVALPRYETGHGAAELAMVDPAASKDQRIELPVQLLLRDSA